MESLERGAVEHWLVRMLGHAHRRGTPLNWTFYCTIDGAASLADEAMAFGARVIRSPVSVGRQAAFVRELRAALKQGGYDVLHCHHDLVAGLYLIASAGIPIRRRLVHVHNADEHVPTSSRAKQLLYRPLLRRTCLALADRVVGISHHTLDTFLAGRARRPGRDVVHYYGVDPAAFNGPQPSRSAFRRQHGLSEDTRVLLFGGRLVPEKNPAFTIDVLAALRRYEPRAVALFAGSGSDDETIRERAKKLGVDRAVRMLGWRRDLAQIMRCADWFILPHPEHPVEGFGVALVEAQLAGLRLLLSKGVSDEPLLSTAVFRRLSLGDAPDLWARAAVDILRDAAPAGALDAHRHSPMDMDFALADLLRLYQ